ncbi:MAG: 4-hydroxybenzoate octaprenyltransferase, partial [Proteobacteria bacterium]|nr:4-hydroxybenzoate octaprenyltransferase [Pseudomonadota bacterium]
ILFGDADRVILGILQALMLFGLLLLGQDIGAGYAFYTGLGIATVLGTYQQYLIRRRDPEKCFRAFLNNNWLGAAIFAGILFNYW